MSLRKEVFRTKVLQRLYPAAPRAESAAPPSPTPKSDGRAQPKTHSGSGTVGQCGLARRKMYTVLLPPEDYRPPSADGSATPIRSTRTTHKPAGSDDQDGAEDEDLVRRRRRRRRKRKVDVISESGEVGGTGTLPQGGAAVQQTDIDQEQNLLVSEGTNGTGQLSRNQKRKMKKKRHKEKLLSLGLVPQPRAIEFTYTPGGEEEVENSHKGNRQKLAEILDFLRSTWDLYLSDRSSAAARPFSGVDVAESLFARLSGVTLPPAGLTSLHRLGALLGQRDVGQMSTALKEFSSTSMLPADETAVVCTLFHYWITEVLPMQKEKNP